MDMEPDMSISNLISLLSGIALFLFGMSLMGDGLKKVAGNKLEVILYQLTGKPLKGFLLGTAVTAGHREFAAIAVAGGKDGVLGEPFYPCGVCRQVMREFCTLDMPVYVADGDDGMLELTLGDILPHSFGKEYL